MVEHAGSSSKSNSKGKGKDKRKNEKKSKGKAVYLAPKAGIDNMVNDNMDMIAMVSDAIAMKVVHGQLRNYGYQGQGDVILKMISEKELKLTNSYKFVLSKNQMYVGKKYVMNGMFKLNVMVVINDINKMNSSAYLVASSNVWHGPLGHVNFNSMRCLIKFNSIPNFHIDSKNTCETCVEAKLTRSSFKSVEQKTEPLDMIHTDICDLKSLHTKGGNKYFITFSDDCTKYCYVYLLKSKDDAIDKFVLYKNEVENKLGKKIKVVRSDRGGEYVSPFTDLCVKHGIRHKFTAPYSPQQNGHVGEAILTATYLSNKIHHKKKEETPYELWMGRKPSYQYLRVWGWLAKVVVLTPKAQKIGPKSVDCIFIGYTKNSSACRFIVHDSKNPDIQKNTIMESRNASFFENIFPCLTKKIRRSSRIDDKVVQENRQQDDNDLQDERQGQPEEEGVELRRGKRAIQHKVLGGGR
ncbi:retrovirus-related pol polyprotein from transposon TNT 1-94 [Tanacetum coccineum]